MSLNPAGSGRTERPTARVVVLDRDDRVLLVRVVDALTGRQPVWLTPGGGVDPGEELADAAARELEEETGLSVAVADLGRPVAVSRGDWEFRGQRFHSENWYFIYRTETFDPDESGWTDLERELHGGWHWWSLEELDTAAERVIPAGLADLIRQLGSHDRPNPPVLLEWIDG